ncbi:MAG: hypothetical protein R3F62_06730 [Planctomycetota bacterium]
MSARNELTPALEALSRRLTLKELRKRKIHAVRVVTRSGLNQALGRAPAPAPTVPAPTAVESGAQSRRVQRLLEENEKLGQTKIALEHEKGLAESERSRLQAELQAVLAACGKATQKKVSEEDLKAMVAELGELRQKYSTTTEALDTAQKQLAHRERTAQSLEEKLRQRQQQNRDLSENVGAVQRERSRLITERDRYREERDQYREERDQYRDERDQYRAERDRFLEERERLREQRDQHRTDAETLRAENDQLSAIMRQAQSALRENEAQLVQVRQASGAVAKERDRLLVELQDTQRKLRVAREELETAFVEVEAAKAQVQKVEEAKVEEAQVEEAQVEAPQVEAPQAEEPQAPQVEEPQAEEPVPAPTRTPTRGRRPAAPRGPVSFGFGFGTPRKKGGR